MSSARQPGKTLNVSMPGSINEKHTHTHMQKFGLTSALQMFPRPNSTKMWMQANLKCLYLKGPPEGSPSKLEALWGTLQRMPKHATLYSLVRITASSGGLWFNSPNSSLPIPVFLKCRPWDCQGTKRPPGRVWTIFILLPLEESEKHPHCLDYERWGPAPQNISSEKWTLTLLAKF